MPRSIWSGAISFGLVNVPVKLYSAVSRKTVRFHQLNEKTGNRIQQKRVDPETGEEVPYEQIVKGFELTKDRYVVLTPDELDALDPERSRTIDIEDFVDLSDIDPIYYDHPYYLVPDKGAAKAYGLLLSAMQESGRVAIARVVLRSKEQLVAIRPAGDVLMMETMIFADEVVPPEDLDGLPEANELKASDRELKMAQQLIDSLSRTSTRRTSPASSTTSIASSAPRPAWRIEFVTTSESSSVASLPWRGETSSSRTSSRASPAASGRARRRPAILTSAPAPAR